MRADCTGEIRRLDSLVYRETPELEPKPGHVVIEIKVFGVNHAEMHMRRGEWAEAAPVSGIKCVGLVKSCPGGRVSGWCEIRKCNGPCNDPRPGSTMWAPVISATTKKEKRT
jgi:NADPH:quinone reductase-like Zn-dependent oxidoreductase